MASDPQVEAARRKAYGRGLFDGLRAAGVEEPEEFMNGARVAKLSRAEQGLNGVAKKILDAVPIQAPWTKAQINSELRRQGINAQSAIVDGCLNHMRGLGLIREPERGMFVRADLSKHKAHQMESRMKELTQTQSASPSTAATKPADPLTRLAAIASAARGIAKEIEDVALEIEEQAQRARTETDAVRQLKALLNNISQ